MFEKFLRAVTYLIVGSCAVIYVTYAAWNNWFPAPIVTRIDVSFAKVADQIQRPWFLDNPVTESPVTEVARDRLAPGLIVVSGVGDDRLNHVRVIDRDANVVQSWTPDWFRLWPNAEGFPEERVPLTQPGGAVHGVLIAENGDLIFNFEKLSTIRMDACGNVVWKLRNFGHHSLYRDRSGNIWLPALNYGVRPHPDFRNIGAPHQEDFIQKLSPDGEVLLNVSLFDILRDNGLSGLLYMSSTENFRTLVGGDILHLNDVEIYEGDMEGEVVKPGDIMVSLRNINSVLLLDADTFEIKAHLFGRFLRQHDPDFIGGDEILVFDNNNLSPMRGPDDPGSRIVKFNLATGARQVVFDGAAGDDFFTDIMGKQQLLPNGNLLVASSRQARAFEVAPDGTVLWQYDNDVGDGYGGIVTSADVLPENMDAAFFAAARARCGG